MTGKRLIIIILILTVITALAAALCILISQRSGSDDVPAVTEQESTESSQEESSVETETVAVADNDAVAELYEALKLAVSGSDEDMEAVFAGFSKAADLGNSDAMYFLGELYLQGIGVQYDLNQAGFYFQQACENGSRRAMTIYGKMLFMGEGTAQDYDQSASCFYTVAEDDGEAAYILGVMSNLGIGVPRSAERAEKYIDKAEQLGYDKASGYRDKIQNVGKSTDGTEGFQLAAKKVQDLDYKTSYGDLQDLIEQYQEIIKSSENYAAFDREMTGLLDVDMMGVSAITLFGNNGYLFHQNENDGTSLHDYIGDNHFSEEELKGIAANLEKEKEWIEQNGAEFVLLLIPNKETMYPEYMPAYINRADTVTREDLLVEYLKENTDITVIYVKDILAANKDKYPLYYKTDTHANMVGSLFMVSELLDACYGVQMTPDIDKFDIHLQDYMGDLGKMAKCTDRYAKDKVYFYPEGAVSDEEKIDSSIILAGDSFSEFINIEMGYYLNGGVDHRMITEYEYDYHAATQAGFAASRPEYVVWECVERYLDRLK